MNREEKKAIVDQLCGKLEANPHYYLTDIGGLNAEQTASLRRKCFENQIELVVVKNTFFKKALERTGKGSEEIYKVLAGETSVMFAEAGNVPARLIKELRKAGAEKPLVKAAYVEECVYIGDKQLDSLVSLKSKNELVADVVAALQAPMQNVLGALNSGGNTVAGLLKTLEERNA